MLVLHLISYIAALVAFVFVTLSLASGLLYIAEIIEEHSITAKTVGQRTIYSIIALHLVLHFIDGIPLHLTILGIFCHLIYLTNFSSSWPFISLTSWKFIASCLLVIVDHFAFFNYFSQRANSQKNPFVSVSGRIWQDRKSVRKSIQTDVPGFFQVASFFGVFVWLIPFFLFLSLSANDNVLPTEIKLPVTPVVASVETNHSRPRPPTLDLPPHSDQFAPQSASIFRQVFSMIPLPSPRRGRTSHRELDGLIAPPSPMIPKSPLASPSISYYGAREQGYHHYYEEDNYFDSTNPKIPNSYPSPMTSTKYSSEVLYHQTAPSPRYSPAPNETSPKNFQQQFQFQKKRATLIEPPSTNSTPVVGRSSSPFSIKQQNANSSPRVRQANLITRKSSNVSGSISSCLTDSSSAEEDSNSESTTPNEFEVVGMGVGVGNLESGIRLMGSPNSNKRKVM